MQNASSQPVPQSSETPRPLRTFEELKAIHEEARKRIAENDRYLATLGIERATTGHQG